MALRGASGAAARLVHPHNSTLLPKTRIPAHNPAEERRLCMAQTLVQVQKFNFVHEDN
jgi:hypothetical protein